MAQEEFFLITGAGCGIGFEIARQLIASEKSVVINDIDAELCHQAAQQLDQLGSGTCLAWPGDCSSVSLIDAVLEEISKTGLLRGCVANAGITSYGKFLSFTEKDLDRLLEVNLKGTFFLIQKASQLMIKQKSGGRIVAMSSVTGVQAHPSLVAYGMTKGGLQMLVRALVPELTPHGILINAIAPGAVQTERTLQEDPDYPQKWGSIYPTGRSCLPTDIARATLFLLSDQNEMINGQTLVVDGGWTTLGPMPADLKHPD